GDGGRAGPANRCGRRAWRCGLRFLAAREGPAEEARGLVLDWLLGLHRGRVNDLLARNLVDPARRHWNLVQELPAHAAREGEALGRDLAGGGARVRGGVGQGCLPTPRGAMRRRDGPAGAGARADYEKGLGYPRRLLSLDRDNLRLLTALVEVCGEWFLDLYNTEDAARLCEQVDRFTPFALQLARRVEDRPGDLSARAALA